MIIALITKTLDTPLWQKAFPLKLWRFGSLAYT